MCDSKPLLLFVANRAEFFCSHRLPIARAARDRGFEVHISTPRDPYVSALQEHGFTWHPLALKGKSLNPLQEVRTIAHLYRLYQQLQPLLVHHVAFKAVLHGGIAARMAGVPGVVNAFTGLGHLFAAGGAKIRFVRWMVMRLSRFALGHPNARTIFQNPDDLNLFVERKAVERADTRLIKGSGVNLDVFTPRRAPTGGPLTVMLASRLVWEKGIGEFVEAARQLRSEGCKARFVLAGKSDSLNPHAVPERQLEAWDEEGVIEWWGFQEDMVDVFSKVHVVCLPSYYREGVPKVLIEAAACERPVVATDMPGCREIVRDGENGCLIPSRDSKSLAVALRSLLADPERRERMGVQGRRVAEEEFSVGRVVRDTMQVYEELLRKPECTS